jgi:phage gp29-like protein
MASTPPLVDIYGRPLKRDQLAQRVAGPSVMGVRSILTGHPAQGLNPSRLSGILRQAEQGNAKAYLELAEEMEEKDLHYLAVLKKRKEAIAQLPIEVIPADDSAEAKADAELVKEFIDRDELQDEIVDMLDAIGKGWSVTEIVWPEETERWIPVKLERVDQRWMEFDEHDGETLYLKGDAGERQDLGAFKYIIHQVKAKSGIPVRGGIARAAAWHYMFKNYAWKDWVSFLETFGMPIRIGRYDNGETEENKSTLLNAIASLGSDAAAMFPKTMEVEFVDGKSGTAPNDLWKSIIDTCDEYLSKVVLGQTNTTDAKSGGLGSGQAQVHREVEETIERSDARRLSTTLNRDLVVPMVMLNHGVRKKYPKIRIGRPDPVDVKAMTDAATALVPMGVRVSAIKMREAAGLPAPENDDDEVLVAPNQSAQQTPPENLPIEARGEPKGPPIPKNATPQLLAALRGQKKRIEGEGVAAAARDAIDRRDVVDVTADEALSDWIEIMEPLVGGIEAKLIGASSIEEARGLLVDALEDADSDAITAMLERLGIAGRLQGELEVQGEMGE